jgi:hypothetical protein
MSRTKAIALGFLGIVIPAALAFTAYLVSRSTIGAAGTVPSITHEAPQATTAPSSSASSTHTDEDRGQGSGSGSPATSAPHTTASPTDDHGGKCSEAEHSADPSCGSGDSSGKGGGGGGGDDSGSDNSGHGGGGDD